MPDKKQNINEQENVQPEKVQENPETTIKRLEYELDQARQIAQQAINENQILRATVKALSQLI